MKKSLRWIAMLSVLVLFLVGCASQSDDLNSVAGVGGIAGQSQGQQGAQTPDGSEGQNDAQQTPGANGDQNANDGQNANNGNQTATDEPAGEDAYAAMKADQSGTPLKILCQNLRYDAVADRGTDNDAKLRRYRFQTLVKKYDPDIIAGQECCSTWIDYLEADYGKEYDMFYEYRGATSGSNEACPILWKKDKYKMVKTGYFWLSDTPTTCSPSFVGGYPRIVNWVRLKDKQTGVVFVIYSAHFSLDLEPEHLAKTREIFATYMNSVGKNEYAFAMGDFNISYQSNHYYQLVDLQTFVDLRDVSQEMAANGHCTLGDIRKGAYNGFSQPDGSVFGDFILTAPRKNLAIDKFGYLYDRPGNSAQGVKEGYVSDHFAVYTEVRMGSNVSYDEYY